jgi:transcriptional regulator with XRE-family HTH domain
MTNKAPVHDDLDTYIATLSDEEQRELSYADAALDLAHLLYQARSARSLSQKEAAARARVQQQAVSRWERSHPNMQVDTLRRYLGALGYTVDLLIRDAQTGEVFSPVTHDLQRSTKVLIAPSPQAQDKPSTHVSRARVEAGGAGAHGAAIDHSV